MNGYDEKMKKLMLENDGGKQSDYVARWIRRENEKVANDILKNFILCSSENNDKYKNVDVDKWDTYVSDSVIRMLFKMNYVEDAFYLELVKYIRCLESEYNAKDALRGLDKILNSKSSKIRESASALLVTAGEGCGFTSYS